MMKSWGVTIIAEHEYQYDSEAEVFKAGNDYAMNTIKVERQVQGDDEACDALYAAQQAFCQLKKQYGVVGPLHVISIEIKEVD